MRRILVITLTLLVSASAFAQEKEQPQQPPPPQQPQITAADLWGAMMKGNQAFVAGTLTYTGLKEERGQFEQAQAPPITVLTCSDSRVPPELVFNQSLGALFVVRSAGNVADEFGIASIEYAISQGYTKLIVILGHENCGAVKACLGRGDPGTPALNHLAQRIRSSFTDVSYDDGKDEKNLRRAVESNSRAAAAQLLAMSKLIRDAVTSKAVRIVTAYYDLSTGEVKMVE